MAKLNLTVGRWRNLFEALKALDGYQNGDERVVYKFTAATQLKIARTLSRLEVALTEVEKTRATLIEKYGVDGMNPSDPKLPEEDRAKLKEYMKASVELDKESKEIVVMDFTTNELSLDKNNIPQTVLAILMPVIPELGADEE